ncbi:MULTISPECIES: ClpXP protease specificity-enhancing factor [unclassified Methylophaga]|uniref:ClpXP protease specificity-enhancing factor n=1 Tax=unclassified Methylophaga TaxID=2629249 RepID=UPI000C96B2CB|nr:MULTISPECIES: ClpXP protease specificity-enhancing factor [unclassified Methylophaga]MAK67326.1 ClpXP protease specificity-enhancing factor [Methylophaga sp.]MAY16868.1 ClpXP protease specificity-enhancing factor [Methylophaga sp.]HAO25064.1 ClpXP protease specificity-enhancing factor [Methylophaga sp.]|tara:strand:- start:5244 stop:5639 length:396 start_codon:yes stop_codon:yes gene_type:complete
MSMSSQKPYLIRAIYQWLLDNQSTPYLLVNTNHEGVVVPEQYIRDARIVLNLAPDAISGLNMDNEWVSFSARFSGKAMDLFIPVIAIQAIYGKENNEGMFFPEEENPTPPTPPSVEPTKTTNGKPSLKLVK